MALPSLSEVFAANREAFMANGPGGRVSSVGTVGIGERPGTVSASGSGWKGTPIGRAALIAAVEFILLTALHMAEANR